MTENAPHPLPHVQPSTGLPSHLRKVLLTWFACGRVPFAPGTVGSLGALPFGWILLAIGGPLLLLGAATALFIAGWLCADAELPGDDSDPSWIVVDEVVGMWIALAAAPVAIFWHIATFVLFRLFDILKPWPVSWADRNVGGGLGVMLDDVLAGLYAALIILIARAVLA